MFTTIRRYKWIGIGLILANELRGVIVVAATYKLWWPLMASALHLR